MKDINALKQAIASKVRLGDILVARGVIDGTMSEEQYCCGIHGQDLKKSARYYRETDSCYCWTCKKSWDIYRWVQDVEGMDFWTTVRWLCSTYNVDISKVPESTDLEVKSEYRKTHTIRVDQKKLYLERLKEAVRSLREHIPSEKYCRLVYAYQMLKFTTPDDTFTDSATKVATAVNRLIKDANGAG